jgi:5,10-methylenetetrahydromethanopterin reductase
VSSTTQFEISIAFQTNKTPAEYRALARLVNHYPFSHVSAYNDLTFQPAIGPLMLMASEVTRAQLGPACLNPFTLHPVEIAGQMALLDHLTQGRAYLGIARGAWLDSLGLEPARPITALREAIQIVKQLLAGERKAFNGKHFRLQPAHHLPYAPYRSRIPVMIGTWGPKLAAVAGEWADEVKVSPIAHPPAARPLRDAIAVGEQKAGREPGRVKLVLGGMCVVDEDRERARDLARREVARYLPIVAPLDPTFQVDAHWHARLSQASQRADWETAAALISDEILDRFAYAGDPHDLIVLLERARAGGIHRVDLGTPHGLEPAVGIRLLGERVLPHFDL